MHGRLRRPRRTRMIEAVSRNQPQLGCWAVGCAALMLALGATSVTAPRPRLVWNASASAPIGLYAVGAVAERSEEHTSELQSLMRTAYAVYCLKKKNRN